MAAAPRPTPDLLAAQVRQLLVGLAGESMPALLGSVQDRLMALMDEAAPSRESQLRRDAWMTFQRCKANWQTGTLQAWQAALVPQRQSVQAANSSLALLGTDVVENGITASRLALGLMENAAHLVNDLRKRLRALNADQPLDPRDIAHPEVLLLPLVEQWEASGLTREAWQLVSPVVQQHINTHLQKAYEAGNELLIAQGVLPVIEFAARPSAPASPQGASTVATEAGHLGADAADPRDGAPVSMSGGYGHAGPGGGSGWGGGVRIGAPQATAGRPYGRAQGVLEQVGRLFGGTFLDTAPAAVGGARQPMAPHRGPSATLLQALEQQPQLPEVPWIGAEGGAQVIYPMVVAQAATELRQQSSALKRRSETDSEKAIIELVALMFQSILQEDRIPPGARVWFARLQMPVLRVALDNPEFFSSLAHPARQLIDHMGSCVMGFDASAISADEMQAEIKRVVQVVEQYPETGDKVYRRVYEEFRSFLKQHLAKKPAAQKVLGVAEQLEQKETLAIQYTIELRDQLKDMPVREEIRSFLFKVWTEVLAVSTVRLGKLHEETVRLKKTATDLIWAASAKPSRADRARVIAALAELLQNLRNGMALLGMAPPSQERHIRVISDTLADAFMAKTEAIADDQIQALAQRLAELDDYISEDSGEELALDTENIEELLGIEATDLDVVSAGGGQAGAVMLEWARDLALGSWFGLKYKASTEQVQLVWRSPLGHLHLFANNVGHSYLFQTPRLAGYLQSGLLEPQEDEPLMARATRNALGEIQANPARLLH